MKLLIPLLLLFSLTGTAQEKQSPVAEKITSFPFTVLMGGVVIVKAHFDSIPGQLNFILDTGSGAISLDSTTAAIYQVPHIPSGRKVTGIAGTYDVDYARHHSLSFPGLTIDSLDFFINNYDILTSVYGLKIDGIIGYSVFSRYIVHLNYDDHLVSFFTQGEYDYPRGGTLLKPIFTALPIIPMTIKDERELTSNYYMDTGGGLCFLVTKQFLEDSAFLKKRRKPRTIYVQGLGGKTDMGVTVIKKITLGPYKFRHVPMNILDDGNNALSYPFITGLIGNDILRRFNVTLNYKEREIHIKPNSHFRDLFDYSYTGMNFYMDSGRIIIDDIVPGSPADKSGLKDGDVVIGIGENFSNNITSYKKMLDKPGDRVNFIISRNGELESILFTIGRIY